MILCRAIQKNFRVLFLVSLTLGWVGCNSSPETPSSEISAPEEIVPSPIPPQSSPTPNQSTSSRFQNRCQREETAFVFAETRDYWLNICGKFAPEFFVAVNKQEQIPVRLPVTDYDLAGKWFEAVNLENEYVLGFQGRFEGDIFFAITQLKPDQFQKTKYFRELTQQPLLQVQAHLIPSPNSIPSESSR
ncbi:MAG: hypothetical protein J7647_13045 [Cyanobacteria bacterium SBLK]|nr:hypothetical protein [Cyanobacteria bacterium SBLK]